MTKPFGNSVIPRSTPMHVEALTLQILRETFKDIGPEEYPYRLTDDFATTRILIDTEFNAVSEMLGIKPILVLSTGGTAMGPGSMQDLATYDLKDGGRQEKTNMAQSSLGVKVHGRTRGETLVLGNEVFNIMALSRTWLPRLTGVQSVGNVTLTQPVPFEQDTKVYMCEVSMNYFIQYKWVDVFTPEVLRAIGLHFNDELVLDLQEQS